MRASILIMPSTVANSIAITIGSISAVTFSTFTGIAVPDEGLTLSLRVMKNESGDSAAAETQSLGTITRDNPIIAQTATFSNPDESARYVVEFYRREPDGSRRCFKTRGEYTNAEVNLKPNPRSFTKWQDGTFSSNADLPFLRPGPSGCLRWPAPGRTMRTACATALWAEPGSSPAGRNGARRQDGPGDAPTSVTELAPGDGRLAAGRGSRLQQMRHRPGPFDKPERKADLRRLFPRGLCNVQTEPLPTNGAIHPAHIERLDVGIQTSRLR